MPDRSRVSRDGQLISLIPVGNTYAVPEPLAALEERKEAKPSGCASENEDKQTTRVHYI
jgi:hypothetical protein